MSEDNASLLSIGRVLLAQADFSKDSPLRDYAAHTVIRICLAGNEGREAAEMLSANIRLALNSDRVSPHNLNYTLKELFVAQPLIALDAFLLQPMTHHDRCLFDEDLGKKSPIESLDIVVLEEWASHEPNMRYPLLGKNISMFTKGSGDEEKDLSPLFLSLLEQAPNKGHFLGSLIHRLHPSSWCGSLADILIRRKAQVLKLAEHPDEQVRTLITDVMPELDRWIERERGRDRVEAESFE